MSAHDTGGDRAPGDVLLVHHNENESDTFVRFPIPSSDPNDPLNWSIWRKVLNFALVLAQTVAVFTALSVQTRFWQQMSPEMGLSFERLNNAQSANFGRTGHGLCVLHPNHEEVWTSLNICVVNCGYGRCELVIADVFFVHQRGTANAFYITGVMVGSFLTPMAAGIQAKYTGWRRSYLALSISLTLLFVVFLFAYEETKYVPVLQGVSGDRPSDASHKDFEDEKDKAKEDLDTALHQTRSDARIPESIPPATYRQRLRWVTYSSESLWKIAYFPAYIIPLPHVLYSAIQYAAGIAWLVIMASTIPIVFTQPPYNFNTDGIGLMNLGPFVGNLLGSFYSGLLSDRSVRWLARRNGGYYEPEMRLYLLLPPALFMAGGIIMFGTTADRGMHWIFPSIGGGLFAFGLGAIGDAALTLVIDAYRPLTAEAFVGIAFVRNAVSIPIPFAINPWLQHSGLSNMFITAGLISFAISMFFVPLIIWGKKIRKAVAPRYYELLEKQGGLMAAQG
ncbi:hypothetical protein INS49_009845 [Diaporthe citri]|uniref:uncharacterized protein n=1 Tax=Diaporthe citri TaxID=83186 RepID=UPI001C8153B4|nr:uncharacterized protein INS49_009845 [Diaporthe citri]KAG6361618.1 hypothetical protein INS49_009845 [Diaporthe citri]